MKPIPALALAAVLCTGCVSKKKYTGLQAELNASQSALADALGDEEAARRRATRLSGEVAGLEANNEEMARALEQLRRSQSLANQRVAEYRDLIARFQEMIDAGTLRVKIVDNRMVIEVGSDILFPTGSAELSPEGMTTALQVGEILDDLQGRRFQVEGHTDSVPIRTTRFPSNDQLAAERAISVMRMLESAGVPRTMMSAAAFADTRPVDDNQTEVGRARNRRVEIALEPDLSVLPGLEELQAISTETAAR